MFCLKVWEVTCFSREKLEEIRKSKGDKSLRINERINKTNYEMAFEYTQHMIFQGS